MREILFRGKTEKDEWVEGGLLYDKEQNEAYIAEHFEDKSAYIRPIIPETVGQYTGLTDKNGKKIFEGDIVRAQDYIFSSPFCDGVIGKIVYDECAFFIEPTNPFDSLLMYNEFAEYEVIGNIHDNPDNPELLKGGE